MDYNRIYEYRFRGTDRDKKIMTWELIARFLFRELGRPASVLDPAAGECEFINAVPAAEKWAVDLNGTFLARHASPGVITITGNSLEADLPENHFKAAFLSNILEHLYSPEEIQQLLIRMHRTLAKGGKIAVMGPNFAYCARNYFDFADHRLILTHRSVEEHLVSAGFRVDKSIARFLPFSFTGRLPVNRSLVSVYLANPVLWKIFGKQFLVIASK